MAAPDGYSSWKEGTSKLLSKSKQSAVDAMDVDEDDRPPRRKSAAANPFAPEPGHPPTARQIDLGAKPKSRRVNYVPPKEKGGKSIWNGFRGGLDFSPGVADSVPGKDQGCYHQGQNCTDDAEAIDHLRPFSERQTELGRYFICDGRNHFEACFLTEAQEAYDAEPLVWSCTKCNSSKGGPKGLYENAPRFTEECPGADCEVPDGGELIG